MGVDSGLPDFRGDSGFWNAYPPYKKLNIGLSSMADPTWFRADPAFAWGFYGHRRNLYRNTVPHNGYHLLKKWADKMPAGHFIFTSNVDSAFQKTGFADKNIAECHGAIEWNQCMGLCSQGITPAGPETIEVDMETMRAVGKLPTCSCGKALRPNIMMFGDSYWNSKRTSAQLDLFYAWLRTIKGKKLAIVECGAGVAIPSVRHASEEIGVTECGGTLIRVNPAYPQVPAGKCYGLDIGALDALTQIDALL